MEVKPLVLIIIMAILIIVSIVQAFQIGDFASKLSSLSEGRVVPKKIQITGASVAPSSSVNSNNLPSMVGGC